MGVHGAMRLCGNGVTYILINPAGVLGEGEGEDVAGRLGQP